MTEQLPPGTETKGTSDYRVVKYLTCQKCGRSLKIRKDGTFPKHRNPRAFRSQRSTLRKCSSSGSYP